MQIAANGETEKDKNQKMIAIRKLEQLSSAVAVVVPLQTICVGPAPFILKELCYSDSFDIRQL